MSRFLEWFWQQAARAWKLVWRFTLRVGRVLVPVAVVALLVLGALNVLGVSIRARTATAGLKLPDVPPLEYAYLDSARVAAYLGQEENGLANSEERTDQITRSLKAGLSGAGGPSLEGNDETQHRTTATVTPNAADDFYTFLRVLRAGSEAEYRQPETCNTNARGDWLGEINEDSSREEIMQEVACVGVGNFVRVHNAQLFLPPFAQALPLVQSTNAIYGALPAARTPFTSPTQSASVPFKAALAKYVRLLGRDPRMPFVAAPYGSGTSVGKDVGLFLPTDYLGLTHEPSLFSGSVTIVAKVVSYEVKGAPYIDYPTVASFGRALLEAPAVVRSDLGVCSGTPPVATQPAAVKRQEGAHTPSSTRCATSQTMLYDVKKSVRFRPPFVILLPLAIYQ